MAPFSEDDLLRVLRSWSSDERLQRARSKRLASSVQRDLTSSESSFTGAIRDLAESEVLATVQTTEGRTHAGRITVVGSDFCAVTPEGRATTLIASRHLAAVQIASTARRVPTPSDRPLPVDAPALEDVLSELAVDRFVVRFLVSGSPDVREGELVGVGTSVCSLRTGRPPTHLVLVRLDHLSEVTLP